MIERALAFYGKWLSPVLHSIAGSSGACRFTPSCSEYAAGVLERHGLVSGAGLAIWRLLRCNPFGRGGFDPVPGVYCQGESAEADPQVAASESPNGNRTFCFPCSTDEHGHLS